MENECSTIDICLRCGRCLPAHWCRILGKCLGWTVGDRCGRSLADGLSLLSLVHLGAVEFCLPQIARWGSWKDAAHLFSYSSIFCAGKGCAVVLWRWWISLSGLRMGCVRLLRREHILQNYCAWRITLANELLPWIAWGYRWAYNLETSQASWGWITPVALKEGKCRPFWLRSSVL